MEIDIHIYLASASELEAQWDELNQEAVGLADAFDLSHQWPTSSQCHWVVDVEDEQSLVKAIALVAALSRRYPSWLWFVSGKDILERWGSHGVFWYRGKPIPHQRSLLPPDTESIERAKDAHVDLQLDCDFYSAFQGVEPSKNMIANLLGPPPWLDDPQKVIKPLSSEQSLKEAHKRIATAEFQIAEAMSEIKAAKALIAGLSSGDLTERRPSQTIPKHEEVLPSLNIPNTIEDLLTLLFEWASKPLDDQTLKTNLLAVLHPDAQRGIKDILRFNWPRFVRQREDYLEREGGSTGFDVVRVDKRPEYREEKHFLKASGRGPAPVRFRRDDDDNWRLMMLSL